MSVPRRPRKSLISAPASIQSDAPPESIGFNDDESERREKVRAAQLEQTPLAASKVTSGRAKLAKMTIAERNDHIEKCMQLSAENKISTKNAFSLLLIDQLIEQVKKQESNFQIASTQLDASAKIYACRVDKVHTEALRIAGGLVESDKKGSKKKSVEDGDNSDGPDQSGDEMETSAVKDKKVVKRRQKALIVKNDVLTSNAHLKNLLKSTDAFLQEMMTSAEASEPGNAYFMSNFGINGSCELSIYNDLLSYGPVQAENIDDVALDLKDLPLDGLRSLMDRPLCPQLKTLLSDSQNNVDTVTEQDYDYDGGLDDNDADNDVFNGSGGISGHEIDDADENEVDGTCGTVALPVACRHEPAAIVDYTSSISSQLLGPLQYSLHHKRSVDLMGGPESWKIGTFITSRPSEVNKKVVARRKPKTPIILEYTDLSVFQPIISSKCNEMSPRTIKLMSLQRYTKSSLGEDINVSRFEKVWMRPRMTVQGMQAGVPDVMRDKSNINSNQSMDTSVRIDNDGGDMFMDDSDSAHLGQDQIEFSQEYERETILSSTTTGNAIPYALRAKKIDMKLLKSTVWRIIKLTDANKENVTVSSNATLHLSFQDVYRDLPSKLPAKMADVLTPHLAFMALLHLANEENLTLQDRDDLSDLIISYG